jgi:HAE1 family hydrophobic/amphiphilic exporter-1
MNAEGAGAASQQAIGTVVFGGMMASTLLAIPFVPIFFVITEGWREKSLQRKLRKEARSS